jgi:hypothetical protein
MQSAARRAAFALQMCLRCRALHVLGNAHLRPSFPLFSTLRPTLAVIAALIMFSCCLQRFWTALNTRARCPALC